jgi:hypothetical protein
MIVGISNQILPNGINAAPIGIAGIFDDPLPGSTVTISGWGLTAVLPRM